MLSFTKPCLYNVIEHFILLLLNANYKDVMENSLDEVIGFTYNLGYAIYSRCAAVKNNRVIIAHISLNTCFKFL